MQPNLTKKTLMKYVEAKIKCEFAQEYLRDLFVQGLADLGFESFIDDDDAADNGNATGTTLCAYIQADALNETALRTYLSEAGQQLLALSPVPDTNWNAAWEAEHPVMELPLGVRITPHCAFGAGHHETTSMMIENLLATDLNGTSVLDMGCGTGVLAIFAAKQGATRVIAVDIDDKSVTNARENAADNHVNIDVRLGSTPPDGHYDLILANIHRNILIDQMPLYARFLNPNGQLWLSGFYETDIPALTEAADKQQLTPVKTQANGEWRMLILRHASPIYNKV